MFYWIPAFAGMTGGWPRFWSTGTRNCAMRNMVQFKNMGQVFYEKT